MLIRSLSATLLGLALCGTATADTSPTATAADFDPLIASDWSGSLTYLNYQEPFIDFTIATDLEVSPTDTGLELYFKYPDEMHKSSRYQLDIPASANTVDGQPLIDRKVDEDGALHLVTAYDCEDMGRAARCEMTYIVTADQYQQIKHVTYNDTGERIRRNAYAFTR